MDFFPHTPFSSSHVGLETAATSMTKWQIGPDTFLADSGASSHMGHCDAEMFDFQAKTCGIKIGDGQTMTVSKIGKKSGILVQADGTRTNVILENFKHVPGLWVNLFSVTQALASGWNLKSDGQMIMLVKGLDTIKFDRIMKTGGAYVCGVDILPQLKASTSTLSEGSTIDINDLHCILKHCGEDTLKLTVKAHGLILKGTLQPCFACRTGNA